MFRQKTNTIFDNDRHTQEFLAFQNSQKTLLIYPNFRLILTLVCASKSDILSLVQSTLENKEFGQEK